MKRVCLVQARFRSSRLRGKVLRDLLGRPMLARLLDRLGACTSIDEIIVATTTHPDDDAVASTAAGAGVRVFRGAEDDVLGRLVQAAQAMRADVVLRVTADCPLIDPGVADRVVEELTNRAGTCDYASNVLRRTYPRGLDAEALFVDTLMRVERLAQTPAEREHVTTTIRTDRRGLFLVRSVEDATDNSDLRWTVDEERDFILVQRLYEDLDLTRTVVPYEAMIAHVRSNPELASLNQGLSTWDPSAQSATASQRGRK